MPKIFDPTLETHTLPASHYGFSAEGLSNLGATEYTLATVVVDTSSSVSGFATEIEQCLKAIVQACRLSPRADNLMLRVVEFNSTVREMHGYTLLEKLKESDYDNSIRPSGTTALFDSTYNAIAAAAAYGKQLYDIDYTVNGIVVVITDGEENASAIKSAQLIADQVKGVQQTETMESLRTILIGLGASSNGQLNTYLSGFKDDAQFDQYIAVADANAKTIAKVADFVSKSISAASQHLGTGGPSQLLTF
ncbi:MAG: VWA domain-containing protein [Armatimonadetes bacterium]|nr:VWA domain-containing protein [Armatimonadota bacterium]